MIQGQKINELEFIFEEILFQNVEIWNKLEINLPTVTNLLKMRILRPERRVQVKSLIWFYAFFRLHSWANEVIWEVNICAKSCWRFLELDAPRSHGFLSSLEGFLLAGVAHFGSSFFVLIRENALSIFCRHNVAIALSRPLLGRNTQQPTNSIDKLTNSIIILITMTFCTWQEKLCCKSASSIKFFNRLKKGRKKRSRHLNNFHTFSILY